jgi:hypothetical protein
MPILEWSTIMIGWIVEEIPTIFPFWLIPMLPKTKLTFYFLMGEVWRNFNTPSWMCEIFNNALANWNCS